VPGDPSERAADDLCENQRARVRLRRRKSIWFDGGEMNLPRKR